MAGEALVMMYEDVRMLTRRLLDAAGVHPDALMVPHADVGALIEMAVAIGARLGAAEVYGERHCRVCGCTDLAACRPESCSWVEANLCSMCAAFEPFSPVAAGDKDDQLRAYASGLVIAANMRCAGILGVADDNPKAVSSGAAVLGQAYAESIARGLEPGAGLTQVGRAIAVGCEHLRETVPLFVQLLAYRDEPEADAQSEGDV